MAKKTNKKEQSKHGEPTKQKTLDLVGTHGRTFEGFVTKKFPTRVVIEFERTVFISKFERFAKKQTRLHARLPTGMKIEIGDYVKVQECRPLSKIIHFVVIDKIRNAEGHESHEEKKQ